MHKLLIHLYNQKQFLFFLIHAKSQFFISSIKLLCNLQNLVIPLASWALFNSSVFIKYMTQIVDFIILYSILTLLIQIPFSGLKIISFSISIITFFSHFFLSMFKILIQRYMKKIFNIKHENLTAKFTAYNMKQVQYVNWVSIKGAPYTCVHV